jgi:hypothetical protein
LELIDLASKRAKRAKLKRDLLTPTFARFGSSTAANFLRAMMAGPAALADAGRG